MLCLPHATRGYSAQRPTGHGRGQAAAKAGQVMRGTHRRMIADKHQQLADFIWNIANKLRGPYRPPQYRRVMLPLIVLRRLDCVLEPTKADVLKQHEALKAQGPERRRARQGAGASRQARAASSRSTTSARTLSPSCSAIPNGLAKNLTAYIKGFSPKVREIFDKFEFENEIEKLEEANRLFEVIKEFAAIDLHPNTVPNLAMGYVFENLIRRFNEQANEEAGDHFTPREVIRLMAQPDLHGRRRISTQPGIARTIYDPTCGTGGMLSVSEEYIRAAQSGGAPRRFTARSTTPSPTPSAARTC